MSPFQASPASFRPNSRRTSAYEIAACTNMLASDTYHTSTSSNPGRVDSHNAGTTKIVTRTALEPMVGQVLPSAWNIDEQLKMMPLAAKFQDVITSICTPTATTASSFVKMCMKNGDSN